MALLFIDSFDHYDPQALDENGDPLLSRGKSDVLSPRATRITGRRPSSFALRIPDASQNQERGGYEKRLPARGTLTVGAAMRWPAAGGGNEPVLLGVAEVTGERAFWIRAHSDGRLGLVSWGRWSWIQQIAETQISLGAGGWHYLELQVVQGTPGLADGSITVRANGEQVLLVSQQVTREASDGQLSGVFFGARPGDPAFARVDADDLYVTDSTGTTNNGFLGDVRIDALRPQANGSQNQWTAQPPTTPAWQALSDDSDATALAAAVAGLRHSVAMQPLPALNSPVIHGVQVLLLARKSDAGQASLRSLVLSGAQTALGAPTALRDSLGWQSTVLERDPNGNAPWTPATLAAAEFGAESV